MPLVTATRGRKWVMFLGLQRSDKPGALSDKPGALRQWRLPCKTG